MTLIKDKMELIQATFQEAKEKATLTNNLEELNKSLLNFPNEFISVAYEGASMALAIKSIQETDSLTKWNDFYQRFGIKHSSQIHVGLGWAFSELNLDLSLFDSEISPLLKYRVLDGYGYYEGIFKRRQSVRTQQTPQHFDPLSLRAYDQGLGRSLWYISQGEVEKLARSSNLFSENRCHDLWRGIGIAVAYVGGTEISVLQQLVNESGQYLPSFKCGVSLLIQSRDKADTISNDTNTIADFLFGLSCDSISERLKNIEENTNSTSEQMYFDWVKNIEADLCS